MSAETIVGMLAIAMLKTSLILIITFVILKLLRNSSASLRHWVCTLALISALIIPVLGLMSPSWFIPVLPEAIATSPNAALPSQSVSPARNELQIPSLHTSSQNPAVNTGVRQPSGAVASTIVNKPEPASSPVSLMPTFISWPTLALALWLIGVAVTLLRAVLQTWRVWRITRRATLTTDPNWLALCNTLATEFGLKRRVRLVFSEQATVPLTWGAWRPVIVMPIGAADWI